MRIIMMIAIKECVNKGELQMSWRLIGPVHSVQRRIDRWLPWQSPVMNSKELEAGVWVQGSPAQRAEGHREDSPEG